VEALCTIFQPLCYAHIAPTGWESTRVFPRHSALRSVGAGERGGQPGGATTNTSWAAMR